MNFRERVLQILKDQGITQVDLANRTGKSRQNISMILREDRTPNLNTITEIAKALGVGVPDLVDSDINQLPVLGDPKYRSIDRLMEYFHDLNISKSDGATLLGVSERELEVATKLRMSLTDPFLRRIVHIFRDLNLTWLLTGKGEKSLHSEDDRLDTDINVLKERSKSYEKPRSRRNIDSNTPSNESIHSGQKGELEFIKRQGNTDFFSIRGEQFLVVSALVDESAYGEYYTSYFDDEFINDLPRHAAVLDRLYLGDYRSFKVLDNSVAGSGEFDLHPGMIVTGRRYEKKLSGRRMEAIQGTQCVIVLKDRTIFTEITDAHEGDGTTVAITCPDPLRPKRPLILYSNDVREIYQIEIASQSSGQIRRERKLDPVAS